IIEDGVNVYRDTWYDDYDLYSEELYAYILEDDLLLIYENGVVGDSAIRYEGYVYIIPDSDYGDEIRTNWKDEWTGSNYPIIIEFNPSSDCYGYNILEDPSCGNNCYDGYGLGDPSSGVCYNATINDETIYLSNDCYMHLLCADNADYASIFDISQADNWGISTTDSINMTDDPSGTREGIIEDVNCLYLDGSNYIDCPPRYEGEKIEAELEFPYHTWDPSSGVDIIYDDNNPSGYNYFEPDPSFGDYEDDDNVYNYDHRFIAGEDYTYSFWFKADSNGTILCDGVYDGWSLSYASGTISLYNNTNKTTALISHSGLSNGTWYHCTLVFNYSDPSTAINIELFINSSLVGSYDDSEDPSSYTMTNTDYHLVVGTDFTDYWTGWIQDIRVYKTAITQDAIDFLYNSGEGTTLINKIVYDYEYRACYPSDLTIEEQLEIEDCLDQRYIDCYDGGDCVCGLSNYWEDYIDPSSGDSLENPSIVNDDSVCIYHDATQGWQSYNFLPFGYECETSYMPPFTLDCSTGAHYMYASNQTTEDYYQSFNLTRIFGDDNSLPEVQRDGGMWVWQTRVCINFFVYSGDAILYVNDKVVNYGQNRISECWNYKTLLATSPMLDKNRFYIRIRKNGTTPKFYFNMSCNSSYYWIDDYDLKVHPCIPCTPCGFENLFYRRTVPKDGLSFKYDGYCYRALPEEIDIRQLTVNDKLISLPVTIYEDCEECLDGPTDCGSKTVYYVYDKADLQDMELDKNGCYHLMNDIDLGGSFTPITANFTGILYGHGFKIHNATVDTPTIYNVTILFDSLYNAKISNVHFDNLNVNCFFGCHPIAKLAKTTTFENLIFSNCEMKVAKSNASLINGDSTSSVNIYSEIRVTGCDITTTDKTQAHASIAILSKSEVNSTVNRIYISGCSISVYGYCNQSIATIGGMFAYYKASGTTVKTISNCFVNVSITTAELETDPPCAPGSWNTWNLGQLIGNVQVDPIDTIFKHCCGVGSLTYIYTTHDSIGCIGLYGYLTTQYPIPYQSGCMRNQNTLTSLNPYDFGGKTTEQLKTLSTYLSAGWNISSTESTTQTIWKITEGSYPYLADYYEDCRWGIWGYDLVLL
ncbi:MAG: hypothetical protein KAX49_12985, partial [Halanaerobiales bacterium]|nr:hypothetical protein [Halanaerobiales bacterium]